MYTPEMYFSTIKMQPSGSYEWVISCNFLHVLVYCEIHEMEFVLIIAHDSYSSHGSESLWKTNISQPNSETEPLDTYM